MGKREKVRKLFILDYPLERRPASMRMGSKRDLWEPQRTKYAKNRSGKLL